jgi:phenylacetic acid degradation protein paaN
MTSTSAPAARTAPSALVEKHRARLDRALEAIRERGFWSVYPESPSPRVYGESAAANGQAAYEALLDKQFPLDQPGTDEWVGDEVSPYGPRLGVRYPHADVDVLLPAMIEAVRPWRDATPDVRSAVCLEVLDRINVRSFELAHAVMHTTGQAFVMAFQAAGPHAQDRAVEAVAYAHAEMTRHPETAYWEKPAGKGEPLRMSKTFRIAPRGIGLVIGCNTFPTWNSYPGLFASLATGNAVLVKPHPRAVLPLAITVHACREVLAEAGFDPNLVCVVAEKPGEGLASTLATRPEVGIVDFTGSTAYGQWLEQNARQAVVYTEKAGVNTVVVDSTDDFAGMCRNLAFSLSLYSGQMCTTPQDVLVPRDGIQTDQGHKSFDEVAQGVAGAIEKLLADDAKAVELTGAIVNPDVLNRVEQAGSLGRVVLDSRALKHPAWPQATARTPVVVALDAGSDAQTYSHERFGPVSFVVATDGTEHSLRLMRELVREQGAITAAVYATSEQVLASAEKAALDAGVALSCNLTGGVFVNQSAAFSDFHATGANPAANATLTDGHYVSGRFRVVQSRRHVPAP